MPELEFSTMGLRKELLDMIGEKGFINPTPIQVKTIPLTMKGNDIMGQARTGTGKTASYGIPILNQLQCGEGTRALVVCPTRELAVQVRNEIAFLGKKLRINVQAVYGGQSVEVQKRGLARKPEILVATPGRLLDHIRRNNINLSLIRFLVLDEADEMLDMGFLPDIEQILTQCPLERQTFLFSATLPEEIQDLGRRFMNDPKVVLIDDGQITVPIVEQRCYRVQSGRKVQALCNILDVEKPPVCLVFCRTKKWTDELAGRLRNRGYTADALHGDMSQRERDMVMQKFRNGELKVLTATDLAARGLDIDLVSHVINFDIPEDPDVYVHRIGRTARAGRTGIALTLVEPSQTRQLRLIEARIGKKIKYYDLPAQEAVIKSQQEMLAKRLMKKAENPARRSLELANRLSAENDPLYLLAAALELLESGIDITTVAPERETINVIDNENNVHVELPVGKAQGMNIRKLVDYITHNTSLDANSIGEVEIHSRSSYVEIPIQNMEEVYQAIAGMKPVSERISRSRTPQWRKTQKIKGR
ncbi:MAG: DEAD/DEAH box helicase [Syntrophomonadaceae bacterium]|nr:DEAD/DEAH box helicase [Syntrophomonadaceae bacterium]